MKKIMKGNPQKMYQKVSTLTSGLDKLFFGGLDLSGEHTVMFIQGNHTTEKTLLGLQLLYRIGQSLACFEEKPSSLNLQFCSTYSSAEYLDDLLLDVEISSVIERMTKIYMEQDEKQRDEMFFNHFANFFFNTKENPICTKFNKNTKNTVTGEFCEHIDRYICQEIVYYSNRTNALHLRDSGASSDINNILYERKYNDMSSYLNKEGQSEVKCRESIEELLGRCFLSVQMHKLRDTKLETNEVHSNLQFSESKENELIAVDLHEIYSNLPELIKSIRDKSKLAIFILPESDSIPYYLADMIIHLRSQEIDGYLLQYLSIEKDFRQSSALGWHQYKRRDYGIEVYPSLHMQFQRRRYLQRALVYTHSDVVTYTFQQYLNKKQTEEAKDISLPDFMETRARMKEQFLDELHPGYDSDYNFVDVLERILLPGSFSENLHSVLKAGILNYCGGVTAIIGDSNTYKRFLTYGSSFSAALRGEHTLLLLLNRNDDIMRRRLSCPARKDKDTCCRKCKECYSFLHFMNISMGYITPEEFVYFVRRQIETCFPNKKKIRRIVIDGLSIVDYCFPLLRESTQFLSALISMCREEDVSLHLICDRKATMAHSLRMLADNVICTKLDGNGRLNICIESFAGYNHVPSKIYACKIKSVRNLFECYEKGRSGFRLGLRNMEIEDHFVESMANFWK